MVTSDTCRNSSCQSLHKWSVGNIVREILMQDQDVNALVGDKIFPLIAQENVEGDFIIYHRAQYSKQSTKMGVYEDECKLALTVVSDNYDSAIAIAAALDNALFGQHTWTNDNGDTFKVNISLDDSTEDFDDNKYIEVLIFNIK